MIQNGDVDFAVGFVYNIHTRRAFASALRPLIGKPLTKDAILSYVSTWIGLSQSTIMVRRAALRHFVRIMAEYDKCNADILDSMVYPQGAPEKRREPVSDEQITKLYGAASETDEKLLLTLLLETGLRLSGICKITYKDSLGESFFVTVKRDKRIEVFTTPTIRSLTELLMAENEADEGDYLFVTDSGGPAYYELLYRKLHKLARQAGVHVTAHMFRHRFITRVAESADISAASELVGHASLNTTRRYVHPSRKRLIEAVQESREAHKYVSA